MSLWGSSGLQLHLYCVNFIAMNAMMPMRQGEVKGGGQELGKPMTASPGQLRVKECWAAIAQGWMPFALGSWVFIVFLALMLFCKSNLHTVS